MLISSPLLALPLLLPSFPKSTPSLLLFYETYPLLSWPPVEEEPIAPAPYGLLFPYALEDFYPLPYTCCSLFVYPWLFTLFCDYPSIAAAELELVPPSAALANTSWLCTSGAWTTGKTFACKFDPHSIPSTMPAMKKAQLWPPMFWDYRAPTDVNMFVKGALSKIQYSLSSWFDCSKPSAAFPKRVFQTGPLMWCNIFTRPVSRRPPEVAVDEPFSRLKVSSRTLSPIGNPIWCNSCSKSKICGFGPLIYAAWFCAIYSFRIRN